MIPVISLILVMAHPEALEFSPLYKEFMSLTDSEALFYAYFTRTSSTLEIDPNRLYRLKRGVRSFMHCKEGKKKKIQVCTDMDGNRTSCYEGIKKDRINRNPIRILAVGDSNTFGWCLSFEDSWPSRLETYLNERSDRCVQVINAGVFGYTSLQCLETVKEILDSYPHYFHIAIFWAGRNDQNSAFKRTDRQWINWMGERDGSYSLIQNEKTLHRFFYLNYLLVAGLSDFMIRDQKDFTPKVSHLEFESNVMSTMTLLQSQGIIPYCLSYEPNEGYVIRKDALPDDVDVIYPFEELRSIKNSFSNSDAEPWFLFSDDVHLNEEGSDSLGQILVDRITATDYFRENSNLL